MDKSKIIALILVVLLLIVGYFFYQSWNTREDISLEEGVLDLCSSDAECPFDENCFGEQSNRCVPSDLGIKECRCEYTSCNSDTDCKDDFVCEAREGDEYGKRCYFAGEIIDDDLDSSESDDKELLATSEQVQAFIQANIDGDTILNQCQDQVIINQDGLDWEIICDTDQGQMTIMLGAFGDIVDYSIE
ncbi:hypothetical protein C0580_04090 [Candidatus Parcubacteria bacterium]|nr:MAG: hypothetical protein C0580_04090 [Candidatus Parcubacteria bacterium]